MIKSKGQRKIQNPCNNCGLNLSNCICSEIPTLNLKTRVSLIIHNRELARTSNTGMLAVRSLVNSEVIVRGQFNKEDPHSEALDLTNILKPEFRPLLFYPSDEAHYLTKEFLAEDQRPIQLLVPDGNWRQASKIHYRQKEIAHIPRVKFPSSGTATEFLRKESKAEGMATLEAIAYALGVIEGLEVQNILLSLYQLKLKRTLQSRGVAY